LVGLRLLTEYLEPAVFGFATLLLGVVILGKVSRSTALMQAVLRYYPDSRSAARSDIACSNGSDHPVYYGMRILAL